MNQRELINTDIYYEFFQLQQENFRLGLAEFLNDVYLFTSCDRIEPPCLFCIVTLLNLILCSRQDLARPKINFGPQF